ncbi:Hypothetical_protein [Hexamita inflata]|uniref:Hypothetical_protein n=1 Tax=Hexamita inflata TaxID=28002 RepID=A0AA86NA62_9EUKA|nr:Hypothetical protein HINF_LOCUS3612 [Hexamita inflata]
MNQTAKLRCGQLVGDIMQIMHTKYFDSNLLFWPQIAWLLVHAAIDPIPQCINCYQIKQLLIEKAYYPNSRVRKYYVKSKPNSYSRTRQLHFQIKQNPKCSFNSNVSWTMAKMFIPWSKCSFHVCYGQIVHFQHIHIFVQITLSCLASTSK